MTIGSQLVENLHTTSMQPQCCIASQFATDTHTVLLMPAMNDAQPLGCNDNHIVIITWLTLPKLDDLKMGSPDVPGISNVFT